MNIKQAVQLAIFIYFIIGIIRIISDHEQGLIDKPHYVRTSNISEKLIGIGLVLFLWPWSVWPDFCRKFFNKNKDIDSY